MRITVDAMTAEFRLLDDLTGDEESLHYAWLLFGGNAEALERARHSITMQVTEGWLEVVHKTENNVQVLKAWQIREVLADEANWRKQGSEAEYF